MQLVGKGPGSRWQRSISAAALCVLFAASPSPAEAMEGARFGKAFVWLWSLAAGQLLAAAALTKHQRILLKSCV